MHNRDEVYTHGHHPVVVAAHAQRTAAEAAAFVLPRLETGMRVLDVGCGPGSITVGLAEKVGPAGSAVGIDNSRDAIAAARSGYEGRAGLTFALASVYQLPFADGGFDAAYGHQVMQHLIDPIAALGEIRRVLRPGGFVALRDADYGTMTHHPGSDAIDRWLDLYHQVAQANGGEPDAGRRLPFWVAEAGFEDPRVTSSTWTFATAAERASWAELWADRTALSHFAERAVELGLSDRTELAEIAAGWRKWAEEPHGWFAFIHGEVVATR